MEGHRTRGMQALEAGKGKEKEFSPKASRKSTVLPTHFGKWPSGPETLDFQNCKIICAVLSQV